VLFRSLACHLCQLFDEVLVQMFQVIQTVHTARVPAGHGG